MQRRLFGYWRLVLLSIFAAIPFCVVNAQPRGSPSSGKHTISATIHAKDRSVKTGLPIWIDVDETNKSHKILGVGRERPLDMDQGGDSLLVDVWDDHGVRPPESAFYRNILGHLTPEEKAASRSEPLRMSSGIAILLKPGEKATNRIDVGRLYDLTRPGTYTIQLHFPKSNKIEVTVNP